VSEKQAVVTGMCVLLLVVLLGCLVYGAAPKTLDDNSLISEHPALPKDARLAFVQIYIFLVCLAFVVPFGLMLIFS